MGNLPEKEFRIMIMKMIQDLEKMMEAKTQKMQEMLTKDLQELKNKQAEMNNTLEGINSKITDSEEQISELEDRMVEITASEYRKKRMKTTNEDILRNLWDNI